MSGRYLIYKGLEGFADRLQSLLWCVAYCRRHARTLYVDWADRVWGGDDGSGGSFYDYMSLVGVPVTRAMPEWSASVTPQFWKGKDLTQPADQWAYGAPNVTAPLDKDHPEGVVVVVNIGVRSWDLADMVRHVRFAPWIVHAFRAALARVGVSPGAYLVAHLRGTDRGAGGASAGARAAEAAKKVQAARKGGERVVVITDDPDLRREFMALVPHARVVTEAVPATNRDGAHKLTPAQLRASSTSKRTLNAQTLTDFLVMAFARDAVSTCDQSAFYEMAAALRQQHNKADVLLSLTNEPFETEQPSPQPTRQSQTRQQQSRGALAGLWSLSAADFADRHTAWPQHRESIRWPERPESSKPWTAVIAPRASPTILSAPSHVDYNNPWRSR